MNKPSDSVSRFVGLMLLALVIGVGFIFKDSVLRFTGLDGKFLFMLALSISCCWSLGTWIFGLVQGVRILKQMPSMTLQEFWHAQLDIHGFVFMSIVHCGVISIGLAFIIPEYPVFLIMGWMALTANFIMLRNVERAMRVDTATTSFGADAWTYVLQMALLLVWTYQWYLCTSAREVIGSVILDVVLLVGCSAMRYGLSDVLKPRTLF